MAKQVKLTAEQSQKFYKEYLTAKNKRFDADEPLDYITWKNYVEEFLSGETANSGTNNWSNTEIRQANRVVARSGETLSRKQNKAFLSNIMKDENQEVREEFLKYYGMDPNANESAVKRFIHEHEGAARRFLVGYSADWNQYFNS